MSLAQDNRITALENEVAQLRVQLGAVLARLDAFETEAAQRGQKPSPKKAA